MHFKNITVLVRLPPQRSATCQGMCMYLITGWLGSYLATASSIWDEHARTSSFGPFNFNCRQSLGQNKEWSWVKELISLNSIHGLILKNQSWKSFGVSGLRSLWLRDAGLRDSEMVQFCYNSGGVLALLCYLKHRFRAFLSQWLETCW